MIYTIVIKDKSGSSVSQVISFNSVTGSTKSISSNVSSNPTESGVEVSDHITVELPTFDISGIITSYDILNDSNELVWNGEEFTPVNQNQNTSKVLTEDLIENLVLGGIVFTLLISEQNDYADNPQTKYDNLSKTVYKEYNNCVATSYSVDDTAGTSGAFFVKLTIKQQNIALVSREKLSANETQPALKKVPRKSGNVGSATTSSSDTSNTNTENLGLGKDDTKNLEKVKEDIESDKESAIQLNNLRNIENLNAQLAGREQALIHRNFLLSQGIPAEAVRNPDGSYSVKALPVEKR